LVDAQNGNFPAVSETESCIYENETCGNGKKKTGRESVMLQLIDVSKTFNPGTVNEKKALSHLNLELQDGDFATIIGSNGAGKSTMFNAICGTFFADEGAVILDGTDITYEKEYKRSKYIGHLFQDPMKGTAPNMSIEENLALAYLRASAVKGTVQKGGNLSAGVGVVDRRTKDEAICLLCLLHKLIHSALKDTATGFAAGTTPDASGDRLISNLEDFCFDSIFFQSTRYLTQCRVGASLFVRASIQQQYLHIHSFFL